MSVNLKSLSEKIQTLSAVQISEVETFVEFLRVRGQERELTQAAAAMSAPAFAAVWNCPKDDVYESDCIETAEMIGLHDSDLRSRKRQ
jgi:hypothetical protein